MSPQGGSGKSRGGDGSRRPTPGGGRGKSFGAGKKKTPKPPRKDTRPQRGGGGGGPQRGAGGPGWRDAPQRGDVPAAGADEAPRLRGDLIYGRNPVH
ncbi:MAG TPA: hypothetical protein VN238_07670, partial [Solirubrobacteraceae bacterium]|nr:hypothetical protein [Solirubrobacteraceae bacterium]